MLSELSQEVKSYRKLGELFREMSIVHGQSLFLNLLKKHQEKDRLLSPLGVTLFLRELWIMPESKEILAALLGSGGYLTGTSVGSQIPQKDISIVNRETKSEFIYVHRAALLYTEVFLEITIDLLEKVLLHPKLDPRLQKRLKTLCFVSKRFLEGVKAGAFIRSRQIALLKQIGFFKRSKKAADIPLSPYLFAQLENWLKTLGAVTEKHE